MLYNSVKDKKVLLINLGWEQESYIKNLLELGVELYGVHRSELECKYDFKKILVCDYFDVELIVDFARLNDITAVISDECDHAIYAAAVVSEIIGCPNIGIEQALLSTNKFLQRNKIKEFSSDICQPHYSLCLNIKAAESFANNIGFPVIIKPVDSRGSFGVSKVNSMDEIPDAFLSAINNSPARQVIIEEFIDGVQITIDGYCDPYDGIQSLALATKAMIDDTTQVSIGINYPGDLSNSVYQKAMLNNKVVATALNISFGMIHAEYMIDKNNDIYLIELANRGGGCFTSTDIFTSVTGVDFSKKLISDCIGLDHPVDYNNIKNNPTNLLFFQVPAVGVLKSVNISEKLKTTDTIINYKIMINKLENIMSTNTDANRHGFIITTSDADSAVIKYALSLIEFFMADGSVVNPILYKGNE